MIAWPVAELVPHAADMILIDAVESFGDDTLRAVATVRPDGLFSRPDGSLPNWLALEIMAQAVAAWAGCQARAAGQPVELGFLLGTRRFTPSVPSLPAGARLAISVARSLHDEASGLGVFECAVTQDGRTLAEARLNVYRPPNVAQYVLEPLDGQAAQPGSP